MRDEGLRHLAGELDALSPRFGRARAAIVALAGRARSGDARAVARGARSVAQEVVRSLLAGAGAEGPPGEDLDPALARLDAAPGVRVPPPARAHLRALSADAREGAAREDAFAALTAVIALLRWYASAYPETVVSAAPAPERPRRVPRGALAAAVLVAAAACAALLLSCRSPEEKLVERRQDLRAVLDDLYARYGGSDLARELEKEVAGEKGAGQDAGNVRRLVGEMDRAWFEAHCLAVGRGERPVTLSGRLDAFVKEPRNAEGCRKAARIEAEILALERRTGRG